MNWNLSNKSDLFFLSVLAFLSFMVKEKNISDKEIQDLQKLIDDYENSGK